ncbi:unnamed protein product [marine sediment metagenome]|uniref:Uncharacterized protein n=1 Tax=marine sediment metagenome TaxID=412755 RepID=X1D719_9ZZZZ
MELERNIDLDRGGKDNEGSEEEMDIGQKKTNPSKNRPSEGIKEEARKQ